MDPLKTADYKELAISKTTASTSTTSTTSSSTSLSSTPYIPYNYGEGVARLLTVLISVGVDPVDAEGNEGSLLGIIYLSTINWGGK